MNRKHCILIIIVLICCFFIGCAEKITDISIQETKEFKELTPKEQVKEVHLENYQYFISGDYEKLIDSFSKDYTDFVKGFDKDKNFINEKLFNDYFSTGIDKFDRSKKVDELLDLNNISIESYEELIKQPADYSDFEHKSGYDFKDTDIFIQIPPKKDSGMNVLWNASYRNENGRWKVISGNLWTSLSTFIEMAKKYKK